jgi:carboxyl-terminal processing protease
MINDLVVAGEKDSIKRDDQSLKFSGPIISRQIKALIARDIYEPGDYYKIMVEDDQEIKKSLEILSDQKIYNGYLAK